jgi:hypothetical protein
MNPVLALIRSNVLTSNPAQARQVSSIDLSSIGWQPPPSCQSVPSSPDVTHGDMSPAASPRAPISSEGACGNGAMTLSESLWLHPRRGGLRPYTSPRQLDLCSSMSPMPTPHYVVSPRTTERGARAIGTSLDKVCRLLLDDDALLVGTAHPASSEAGMVPAAAGPVAQQVRRPQSRLC